MRSMGTVVVVVGTLTLSGAAPVMAQTGVAEEAQVVERIRVLSLRARLAPEGHRGEVPRPWLAQDPADSLYRAAREALNREDFPRSAELFRQIRTRYPRSGYVEGSFYFEALALQRAGGTERLQEGLALLDTMLREHPDAPFREDARALGLRIRTALARRGDAESAAEVADEATQSCEGEDAGIRAAALSALLQMDPERATPILREVLRERDECSAELRAQAISILARRAPSDPETVELLVDLAYRDPDPDPDVREHAVFGLGRAPTEEALDALASILRASDADEGIQGAALHAVSRHESPRAGDILRGYAERADAPRTLRENAILVIGRSDRFGGGPYLRELYGRLEDPELRANVVFAVARAGGDDTGRWLLERARDTSEDVAVRRNALSWAGRTGAVGATDLRTLYGTFSDPEMKEQVLTALGRDGSSESVDALMEIAGSEEDSELRERAIFWLGRTDDPRVPDFLLRLIRGGS